MVQKGLTTTLGHLVSDLCGSSSTRRSGKIGRGAGLPMPFYNLFLLMDFGDFDGKSFADIAIKVFEDGYDLRHGATMAIPILIEELLIKMIWVIKQRYYKMKEWKECMPTSKHSDLRMMMLVGNATLCFVDGIDAAIRTQVRGGSPITFILHLNLVAWGRLIMLIFRELKIKYGAVVEQVVSKYLTEIGLNDAYALKQYYDRMNVLDQKLSSMLKAYVISVEKEYKLFMDGLNKSLNPAMGTPEQRRCESVEFAKQQGVSEDRIIRTSEELRYWLGEGWK